ncbi:sugar-binding transcriptional regulator [Brachybacterium hainanense]|uniref:Sugar-binding transcriptional regulator n=1 Tax=Brachybacterium hainanense TaxID=1541174 RepID=A0ABV6R9S7_9MICO
MQRERDDITTLLCVARLYFEERRTQAQIAQEVGYSRPTVSRMLARAQQIGVVRVTISHPLERILAIEGRLRRALQLEAIRVAENAGPDPIDDVGRMASDLLLDLAEERSVIAVGNGRTVAAAARHVPLTPLPRTTIVQMLGSLPGGRPEWGRDSPTICHQIAKQLGATSARIPIPLFVDDPGLARALLREERVATTMALAARADIALVGVAGIHAPADGDVLAEYLTPEISAAISRGAAVGHILDHHFDAEGRHVRTPLSERTLALSLEELRRIPTVVGVACGPEKEEAIIAAVRGGILDALVTDEATAEGILDRLEGTTRTDRALGTHRSGRVRPV